MKTYFHNIKSGIQIRIPDNDEHMKIFHGLDAYFDKSDDVKVIDRAVTFETPLYDYEYEGIPFTLLFDEMCDETLAFVSKEYDYRVIQRLIESIEVIG